MFCLLDVLICLCVATKRDKAKIPNEEAKKKGFYKILKIKGLENLIILKSGINKSRQKCHADKNVALPRMSFLFKTGNDPQYI